MRKEKIGATSICEETHLFPSAHPHNSHGSRAAQQGDATMKGMANNVPPPVRVGMSSTTGEVWASWSHFADSLFSLAWIFAAEFRV